LIRPPTLRTVGILGAIAGAIALVGPFAWRWFWPTPYATIELPDSSASSGDCFLARGDIAPSTIWKPLWLIVGSDRDRRGWHPLERIDPAPGSWQRKVCVSAYKGDTYHLALVLADRDLDDEFRRPPVETEDDIPEWLKRGGNMEQGGRGRRHREGIGPIPKGAKLVASVAVTVVDGEDEPTYGHVGGWSINTDTEEYRRNLLLFEELERKRIRARDERRVLRSQGAVQVTARAAPDR